MQKNLSMVQKALIKLVLKNTRTISFYVYDHEFNN